MQNSTRDLSLFISELNDQLSYGKLAYDMYLEQERRFVFAKVLFASNGAALQMIRANLNLVPEANRTDALALMFHIEVWRTIWIDEVKRQKPRWNDPFVFDNGVTFPRDEVNRLLALR